MSDLRVSLVQTSLEWLDPQANRQQLQEKLSPLSGKTDLVVLPEMFTSGFTTHPEDLVQGSATIDWLLHQAKTLNAAITGSVAMSVAMSVASAATLGDQVNDDYHPDSNSQPSYVNRLLFATPEGELIHYDKVHLFRMGDEHKRYQPGKQRTVIEYKGWKILLTVCYDLRFPVFCRNRNDYDLMLCVANWPEPRRQHWRTLLQARAIENQAYMVGVNRIGTDGHGLEYSGDSLAIDYLGDTLIDQPGEWVASSTLSLEKLADYRNRFPAWQDADEFTLSLRD